MTLEQKTRSLLRRVLRLDCLSSEIDYEVQLYKLQKEVRKHLKELPKLRKCLGCGFVHNGDCATI